MDRFGAARRAALALFTRCVEGGADPAKPPAIAATAARILDLEIAWLPRRDPALRGARALYDHQTGTICAEDDGTPAERDLVIAHEIGHAVLHESSAGCAAPDVTGLGQAVAYGPRERKELAANVFARHLLLPATRARELVREQGMSARRVAEIHGLPLDIVRQQLLDALHGLDDAQMEASEEERSLDASQRAAAHHTGSPLCLDAGPGTGKTETLLERVRFLTDAGADPTSILVLTYSTRAATELSDRLAARLGARADGVWVGTFHAFGLDLVRQHHEALGLPADPEVIELALAVELLEERWPLLDLVRYGRSRDPAIALGDLLRAIGRAKDELATAADVEAAARRMRDEAKTRADQTEAERALELARVYATYERLLRARGAVDFGDQVMLSALLLARDTAVREGARQRYRHLLVDEYQDVNEASATLLRHLAGDGERLWVVGDARQAIYRFRGAASSQLRRFASDFPGATRRTLDVSYRSSPAILDCVGAIAARMGASEGANELELVALPDAAGPPPTLTAYATLDDEARGVASAIAELVKRGIAPHRQAVLCRRRSRLGEIARALTERGIPVREMRSLIDDPVVKELLGDPEAAALHDDLPAWDALAARVFDRPGAAGVFTDPSRADAFARLMSIAREHRTLRDLKRRLRTSLVLGEAERLGSTAPAGLANGVQLMTIHASKGLEIEAVHLPGLTARGLPGAFRLERCRPPTSRGATDPRRDHEHEEECLFFVAVSRARRVLCLYRSTRDARGATSPSPFLGWIGLATRRGTRFKASTSRARAAAAPEASGPIVTGRALRPPQVDLYASCPKRFFFQETSPPPGDGHATPLARAEGAVLALASWAVTLPEAPSVEDARARIAAIWEARELTSLPQAELFRRWAEDRAEKVVAASRILGRPAREVTLTFATGEVTVRLHGTREAAPPAGQLLVLRAPAEGPPSLREALALFATRAMLGARARLEVMQVDDPARPRVVSLSRDGEEAAAQRIERLLSNISRGRAPARPDLVTCGRCPYLFRCDASSRAGATSISPSPSGDKPA